MKTRLKEIRACLPALPLLFSFAVLLLAPPMPLHAQGPDTESAPPPSTGGFFPLSEVRKGMTATAWTVFQGTRPEPMQVEILGVLRGARGPGQDMILAQLHGAKPEYTGVVAGMSGSPVYIGKKLLGSLSYRIGEFSKDPIAGITPIAQMLEVRDLPIENSAAATAGTPAATQPLPADNSFAADSHQTFQAMETPLVVTGLHPEAIRLWQQQMAGTGLETVAAGGGGSTSLDQAPSAKAAATMEPGSAVSAQLVRGDIEISATCTVTYIDPKQLLACGHPILQVGPVSLPMTTAEVVATLASPLDAFKIINTGDLIGTFTEDRASAIRGVLGQKPRMIPVHISTHSPLGDRNLNVEILDLPSLTPQAMMVTIFESLLESNQSTAGTSYHLTGSVSIDGEPDSPLDQWVSANDSGSAPLGVAVLAGTDFAAIYSNGTRRGAVRSVDLHVDAIPRRVQLRLDSARILSGDIAHPGDTVTVEVTLTPWQQPARNVRIPIQIPARIGSGNLRILVSDAGTLDHTLDEPRFSGKPLNLQGVLAQARSRHPADHIYVSLLVPDAQAGIDGQTLSSLPLSVANALEPLRVPKDVSLNGESVSFIADAPAGGVTSGFQILNIHIQQGGSLN